MVHLTHMARLRFHQGPRAPAVLDRQTFKPVKGCVSLFPVLLVGLPFYRFDLRSGFGLGFEIGGHLSAVELSPFSSHGEGVRDPTLKTLHLLVLRLGRREGNVFMSQVDYPGGGC